MIEGGYVQRANAVLRRLRSFHDFDLAGYNALILPFSDPCPAGWKPKITAEEYKAAAALAPSFPAGDLAQAKKMILSDPASVRSDLRAFLACPGEMMEEGDLAFWEAAMCTLPRPCRPAAARRFWLFPLFNGLDFMAELL